MRENSGFTRSRCASRKIEAQLRNGGIELAIVVGTARSREASLGDHRGVPSIAERALRGSINTEINDVVADR
jgi:hypothetical protein